MKRFRPITLDSNIFISKIKGDETYSNECGALITRVGADFFLVEPAMVLTEVGNAVGRNINLKGVCRRLEKWEYGKGLLVCF